MLHVEGAPGKTTAGRMGTGPLASAGAVPERLQAAKPSRAGRRRRRQPLVARSDMLPGHP
jgi:hypothetical protein